MRQWYTHLIKIESIIIELDKMDLSKQEKLHLAGLIDSSLHSTILDAVLSGLSEGDKRIFINNLQEDNHAKIWQFLNEKIEGVEDKIKMVTEDLIHRMHKDLKIAQSKRRVKDQ